jgi:signal transduction histidine kinase
MLIIILIILVGIGAFSVSISSYYYKSIQAGLETKAKTATDFFANYITKTYAEYYQSAYKYTELFNERDRLELQFINASGKIEVSSYGLAAGTSPGTPDISEAVRTGRVCTWKGENPSTGERIIAVSSPMIYSNGQVVGVIRYVSSLRLVDRQVTVSVLLASALGLAIILLTFLINLIFIRSIVAPVQEVTVMTRQIADGGYGGQIENKYSDEIGEMVNSINEMSMQISRSEKMKAEFISSVSHELRTPLTAITGWGETLMYDEGLSEDSRKGLEIILKEAKRLTNMVEELLDFTRIEDGRFTISIEKMDVEAELEESMLAYGELLKQDGIELEFVQPSEQIPIIPGDPERLKQVFLNILDNAAKHGGSGKRIVVSISVVKNYNESGRDYVRVRVRDFGPGIPPDELPHVKYKFYKGSSKARGSGIGLAVCDEIVRLHGGILSIENAADTGTVVTVLLPVAGAQK